MAQFLLRRLVIYVLMLFVMSIVAYGIIEAPPGDYVDDYVAFLRSQGEYDEHESLRIRERYGLDEPIYVRYFKWATGLLRWDLGISLEFQQPVTELVNQRLVMTIILGLFTVLFTWTLAIPIGILSAVKQYSVLDYVFTFVSYLGIGTPNFLFALVLMWTAFAAFDMSVTGLFSRDQVDAPWGFGRIVDLLKHIWVPMIIIGTDGTARLVRILRANLLDELGKPYVETARARGLPERTVILEVSGAHSSQPVRQYCRLDAANAFLRQPDRGSGDEPPDHWASTPEVAVEPRHVHGRVNSTNPNRTDPGGDVDLGYRLGSYGSPYSPGSLVK